MNRRKSFERKMEEARHEALRQRLAEAGITNEDWNAIRDALNMRIMECKEIVKSLKNNPVERRLKKEFERYAEQAMDTYEKLEELELI